jgi:V/A-type H+/Na+-transporting ATPase subunit E
MEILKTSEALEKQILEDARKKASRVLETVEKEIAAIRAQDETRGAEESRRLDAACEAKLGALRQELGSSLPLDFMRTRLAATEKTLRAALADLFDAMSADELDRLLATMLRRAGPHFKGKPVTVSAAGVDPARARRIVAAAIPDAIIEDAPAEGDGRPGPGGAGSAAAGIILTTTDRRIRYRATLADLTALLMEERREEMATALLGKDAEAQ